MEKSRLTEMLERSLAKARPVAVAILAKAGGSAADLVHDDILVTELAQRLYQFVPMPMRLFVHRKVFVRFVLGNRDALIPLLTSISAKSSGTGVGRHDEGGG